MNEHLSAQAKPASIEDALTKADSEASVHEHDAAPEDLIDKELIAVAGKAARTLGVAEDEEVLVTIEAHADLREDNPGEGIENTGARHLSITVSRVNPAAGAPIPVGTTLPQEEPPPDVGEGVEAH